MKLLEINNLKIFFDTPEGTVKAINDVSLELLNNESLAIVGESGSGKTTIGRSILQLDMPRSGSVNFGGQELLGLSHKELRPFRKRAQIIFQDPFGSLDPRMTVGRIIAEPMIIHGEARKEELRERVLSLLERVDLGSEHMSRYPHAFSGGQRQRICIARVLSLNPNLIIADESVAALDVTIQAQVINLLMDLQAEQNISFLFISHDMAVVERIAHRVAVMYAGEIVEIGGRRDVFNNPQHSYTKKLLGSVPVADPRQRKGTRAINVGEIPSVIHPADYEPVHLPFRHVRGNHYVREEE